MLHSRVRGTLQNTVDEFVPARFGPIQWFEWENEWLPMQKYVTINCWDIIQVFDHSYVDNGRILNPKEPLDCEEEYNEDCAEEYFNWTDICWDTTQSKYETVSITFWPQLYGLWSNFKPIERTVSWEDNNEDCSVAYFNWTDSYWDTMWSKYDVKFNLNPTSPPIYYHLLLSVHLLLDVHLLLVHLHPPFCAPPPSSSYGRFLQASSAFKGRQTWTHTS